MKKLSLIIFFLNPLLWGANLNSCVGCHGVNFQKKALGNSKVVKNMSREEIISTMKGYRDGTYGGAMKSVMVRAVKYLSDRDIEEIADKIKNL